MLLAGYEATFNFTTKNRDAVPQKLDLPLSAIGSGIALFWGARCVTVRFRTPRLASIRYTRQERNLMVHSESHAAPLTAAQSGPLLWTSTPLFWRVMLAVRILRW